MAMYYYARKLQKGAKVKEVKVPPQPTRRISSSSGTCSGGCNIQNHHAKQQIPPLPPPLSSCSRFTTTTTATSSTLDKKFPSASTSASSSSSSGADANKVCDARVINGHPHPPCCSGLKLSIPRSLSRYENIENYGDEESPSKRGQSDDEIYYNIPNGMSTPSTHSTHHNSPNYDDQKHLYDKQLKSLEFKNGELVSGSWESVVELVLPTETNFPKEDFLFAFLLCSRLHNPPHLTLAHIFRYFTLNQTDVTDTTTTTTSSLDKCSTNNHQNQDVVSTSSQSSQTRCMATSMENDLPDDQETEENSETEEEEEINLDKSRVHLLVKLLNLWTHHLPHDFRDDRVMYFVRIIVKVSVQIDSNVREEVSSLLSNLRSKLTYLEVYEASLRRIRTETSIGEPIAAPSVVTICPNPTIMAHQLTLVELQRFSFIGAQEFVAQLVRKEQRRASEEEGRVEGASDTQNLDAFIDWFKRLSMFTASEIVKMSKKKSRCRVIEYWIQVGKECLKIRNFNSLMAILQGLSLKPVARLKKAWGKINCGDLIELQTAMDPKTNFSAYRTMYKASVWRSLQIPEQESQNYKILVPYFSLLLRDVYNLNFTYPSTISSSGHVNLEKYNQLTKLIKEIMAWQSIPCQFVKIQSVFNAVQALPIYNEEELMEGSYGCETPDNAIERDNFTRLRQRDYRINPLLKSPSNTRLYHV